MLEAPLPLPNSKPGRPVYPSTKHHLVIIDLVKEFETGAEIGVLRGTNLDRILTAVPTLHMIGVDAWKHKEMQGLEGEETYKHQDMRQLEKLARGVAIKHKGRCEIVKGESLEVAKTIEDESLDFVFIDASHTTPDVIADILAWAPKVKETGLIIGHDWWFPSVREALEEVAPGWERHEHSVWSLPKSEYRVTTEEPETEE